MTTRVTPEHLRSMDYLSRFFILSDYLNVTVEEVEALERGLALLRMTPLMRFTQEVWEDDRSDGGLS